MKVLIMDPSGAGKTYLSKELKNLGINAVDADSIEALHSWYDGKGNKVSFPENAGREFLDNHSFLWNREFLKNYLKENPDVYLFGMSGNAFDMLDLFDKVYFLKVPPVVIDERLQHESRENPMGKTEYQRKIAVEWAMEIEKKAKEKGIAFLDATLSPEKIHQILTV